MFGSWNGELVLARVVSLNVELASVAPGEKVVASDPAFTILGGGMAEMKEPAGGNRLLHCSLAVYELGKLELR